MHVSLPCFLLWYHQTLGTPSVPVATVVMAGSLMQMSPVVGKTNGRSKWTRGRITMSVLHIVCRLIAVRSRVLLNAKSMRFPFRHYSWSLLCKSNAKFEGRLRT